MTDTTTPVKTTFADLVANIAAVRGEANGAMAVSTAVDMAIQGTIAVIEEAQRNDGVTTITGLNKEVVDSWADDVNS